MTIEGKKTVSLEIFRQLAACRIAVRVGGDGCILSGVYKGFRDLRRLGLADRLPWSTRPGRGLRAIARAFERGVFVREAASTVADSICVDVPRNGFHALRQLREHNGRVVRVSDEHILAAQRKLAGSAGLFTEPAGAAAFAGFLQMLPQLPEGRWRSSWPRATGSRTPPRPGGRGDPRASHQPPGRGGRPLKKASGGYPSEGWVMPPCMWTFLSDLGEEQSTRHMRGLAEMLERGEVERC